MEGFIETIENVIRVNDIGEVIDTNSFIDGMEADLRGINIDPTGLELVGNPGEYVLKRNGKEIDPSKVSLAMSQGELLDALEEMGYSSFDSDVVEYARKFKQDFNNQAGVIEIEKLKENTSSLVDPVSFKDFQEQVSHMQGRIDNMIKELQSKVVDDKVTVGTWVKRTIYVAGGIITMTMLYEEIKKHQKKLNGCWKVELSTANKCKVGSLTCPEYAEQLNNPCSEDNSCVSDVCHFPCFDPRTCIDYDEDNHCATTIGMAKCKGPCKLCSKKWVQVPTGYQLVCVNMSFWQSADDFFSNIVTPKPWAKWILIGLAVLIVVIVIRR